MTHWASPSGHPLGPQPDVAKLWISLALLSGLSTWFAYGLLPSLAAGQPWAALLMAPGLTSLVATWGTVGVTEALIVVACLRLLKVIVGYEASARSQLRYGGTIGQLGRLLKRTLPKYWG